MVLLSAARLSRFGGKVVVVTGNFAGDYEGKLDWSSLDGVHNVKCYELI